MKSPQKARKCEMSKQAMRDEAERLVKEALERKNLTVKQGNRVADEIDQDLGQAAAVTVPWRQFAGKLKLERELFVRRQRLKRAADGLRDVLNAVIGKFEFELASLDLG